MKRTRRPLQTHRNPRELGWAPRRSGLVLVVLGLLLGCEAGRGTPDAHADTAVADADALPEVCRPPADWTAVLAEAKQWERVPQTCTEAAVDPDEITCRDRTTTPGDGIWQCNKASDCEWGGVCMLVGAGGPGRCQCEPAGCVTDADCPPDKACFCGTFAFSPDGGNESIKCYDHEDICGSGCVTTSCRTSADCPGGLCVVDKGRCALALWQPDVVWGAHCLTPDNYDCVPNARCEPHPITGYRPGVTGQPCTWDEETERWTYQSRVLCD